MSMEKERSVSIQATGDSEIVKLLWDRREEAIKAMEETYERYCLEIAHRILENREDAEECVNSAWLKTWNSIPPNRPANLKLYLAKIVRNLSLDALEKRKSAKRGGGRAAAALEELENLFAASGLTETVVEQRDFEDKMNRFLGGLEQAGRCIFLRRFWYMETVPEIAVRCGLKQKTIYKLLDRQKRQFSEFWKGESDGQ